MRMTVSRFLAPLLAGILVVSGGAHGHGSRQGSSPADGSVVQSSPPVITISFETPMRITRATLQNARGKTFELDRPGGLDPSRQFKAVPETLPPGNYQLKWRGLAEDGHAVSGSLKFTVE